MKATFNINGTNYTVKTRKINTNSNKNLSVHVFKNSESTPDFGTIMGENTTDEFILAWAKNRATAIEAGGSDALSFLLTKD